MLLQVVIVAVFLLTLLALLMFIWPRREGLTAARLRGRECLRADPVSANFVDIAIARIAAKGPF